MIALCLEFEVLFEQYGVNFIVMTDARCQDEEVAGRSEVGFGLLTPSDGRGFWWHIGTDTKRRATGHTYPVIDRQGCTKVYEQRVRGCPEPMKSCLQSRQTCRRVHFDVSHDGRPEVSSFSGPTPITMQSDGSDLALCSFDVAEGLRARNGPTSQGIAHKTLLNGSLEISVSQAEVSPKIPRLTHQVVLAEHCDWPQQGTVEELERLLDLSGVPWLDFWRRDVSELDISEQLRSHIAISPLPSHVPVCFCIFVGGSAKCGKCGWGLVLTAFDGWEWSFVGWAGGRNDEGLAATNNVAECQGLLMAISWAMSVPKEIDVEIVVDSSFSLGSADGSLMLNHDSPSFVPAQRLRFLMQWHERWRRPTSVGWVKSHCGVFGNELADRVADHFMRTDFPASCVPFHVCSLHAHPLLAWAWMAGPPPRGMCDLRNLSTGRYEPCDNIPLECAEAVLQDVQRGEGSVKAEVCLKLLSANVCTIRNKCPMLRRQFVEAAVHVAALQETRHGNECSYKADGWLCVHSAAVKGQHGCAFWFHCQGLAETFGVDVFDDSRVTVIQVRADWLAVRVVIGRFDYVFITFHAPHSKLEPGVIEAWWRQAERDMRFCASIAGLIVMGDANARVSCDDVSAAGPLALDFTDLSGRLFGDLCGDFHLCLANTFPSTAGGEKLRPSWKDRCLDYICVPEAWIHGTEVSEDVFDLGNQHDDHEAVCVEIRLIQKQAATCADENGKPRGKSCRSSYRKDCSWRCNVHKHAEHVFDEARRQPAHDEQKPHKPYVSAGTWQIVQQKKQCLAQKNRILRRSRLAMVRVVMRAWLEILHPHDTVGVEPVLFSVGNRAEQGMSRGEFSASGTFGVPLQACWGAALVKVAAHLHCLSKRLHNMLKKDKLAYLEGLLAQAEHAATVSDGRQLWQALKYFRKSGPRLKVCFRPLIKLLDETGQITASFHEQQQLKARHFGNMEASVIRDSQAVAGLDFNVDAVCAESFDLRDLPSLFDIEQGLRKLPKNKAPGPSKVKNEVWLRNVAQAARHWIPVIIKSHVRLSEPLRFNTGILHTLYKGVGDKASLLNWRSIFLLEGVGKCSRKLIRNRICLDLDSNTPLFHQGFKSKSCSAALTHYIVTWLRVHRSKRCSSGILFLDLRSAFYRVLRCRLVGRQLDDHAVCDILSQMGVDDRLFGDILAWASGNSLLARLSGHSQRVVRSFLAFSAFLLHGEASFFCSRSGTRPGDTLADVLFAVVLADCLASVSGALAREGLCNAEASEHESQVPVWADDVSVPFGAASPCDLGRVASRVCQIVHLECCRRALEPNYKKGKTELLLCFAGQGADKVKQNVARCREGVSFQAHGRSVHVQQAQVYQHLGTALMTICAQGLISNARLVKLGHMHGRLLQVS